MAFNWKKMREDFEGNVINLSPDAVYAMYDGPSPDDEMWEDICQNEKLSQELIDKLSSYINWTMVCKTQSMTPEFVIQNLDKINLPALKENPTLDLSKQEWQKLVPYMEPGKGKPYFMAQKDNDEQYIMVNVISPKALAEAMAVELVGKGIKAKEAVENIVEQGRSFLDRAKNMTMRIKQMPREALDKVKERTRESYNAFKEKAAQTVQDIAHDNYQVTENFVSFKVRKPSFIGRTRTVFNKADIISPAEMAAVFLNMKENGHSVRDIVTACSVLKDTGIKFLKDISPVRMESESELDLARR